MQSFDWFWMDDFWLPPNVTWKDLEPQAGVKYADFEDLLYPVPTAFVLILLRYVVERHGFRPFGKYLGLKENQNRKAQANGVLERRFQAQRDGKLASNLGPAELKALSQSTKLSERQVQRWMRKRSLQDKPSTLDKFCETGWRWLYYTAIFFYGLAVLWHQPWLWDIRFCWYDYPRHSLSSGIWWYYMIELSFYWGLAISQFFDVKRKDFWEMFIHHITTIALLSFSWMCNLTRVGTLVLLIHDCADVLLEAAKMAKYANYQRLCDVLFAFFALTWIVTRLGVYPSWILYSTTIEAPQIVEMFPAYYFFNGLLTILLMLHVIWTYFILKIVHKAMSSGKMDKDSRSESSDTLSTSSEDNSNYLKGQEGSKKQD